MSENYTTLSFELEKAIGGNWKIEAELLPHKPDLKLFLINSVTFDILNCKMQDNSLEKMCVDEICKMLESTYYVQALNNRFKETLDHKQEEIKLLNDEVQRLKQFEIYYNLEKEMRSSNNK